MGKNATNGAILPIQKMGIRFFEKRHAFEGARLCVRFLRGVFFGAADQKVDKPQREKSRQKQGE